MIEIELKCEGSEVRVAAFGSRSERPAPRSLGAEFTLDRLEVFAKRVGSAVRRGARLDAATVEEASRLYEALFQGELRDLIARAAEASSDKPLVRLLIRDRALQKIPWEALCRPGTSEEFIATGSRMLVARGVAADEPCEPRRVRGAVRLLAVAPAGDAGLEALQSAMNEAIEAGEIEWLEPIAGERATPSGLFQRLRTGASPHIIHFTGHGGLDEDGHPTLRLADDDYGDEVWVKAETLAQELKASFGDELGLVMLEACEGARPGLLGSAAEIMAQAGARAAAAYLWPVKADAGRKSAANFYRALTKGRRGRGDVAASLCAARRTLLAESAEGLSLVLYLRGDPRLFDFGERSDAPAADGATTGAEKPRESRPFFIPFPRDPRFVGRDSAIKQLHDLLQAGGAIGVGALTGMGGIGKTQLAVEYAYRHRDAYAGGVFWVNAAKSWQGELAALAEKVGLREDNAPESDRQRRLARAFADYLVKHPGALVIFDNVEDPLELRDASLDIVPTQLACRLLFTSRRQSPSFPMLNVRVLAEADALALLLGRSARRAILENGGAPEELATATAICRTLGCLPLAIAIAAAYLDKRPRITLAGYLNGLVKQGALLVTDAGGIDPRELGTQHEKAVRATLEEQWSALGAGGSARDVLKTAALLGEAEQVPRARLALLTGLSDQPEDWRDAPLSEALSELAGLSLVETLTEHAIRLHPLVREFAEKQIQGREAFAAACAGRLGEALWDMERLHNEAAQRGIDALLADLRGGLALAGAAERARIEALLRPLDRESHWLRKWNPASEPGFFLQQLRNLCFEIDSNEGRDRAEAALEARRWPWLRERIWTRRESSALIRTMEGHTARVTGVAITADDRLAISSSFDETLIIWDIATGQALSTLTEHKAAVVGVATSRMTNVAVSASWDNALIVWDLAARRAVRTLYGHQNTVAAVAVAADGSVAISASEDGMIILWDLASGEEIERLAGQHRGQTVLAMTDDARLAVSVSIWGALNVWDVRAGECVRTIKSDRLSVTAIALSKDGRLAVTASQYGTLKLWDLEAGVEVRTLGAGSESAVTGIALTGDDRLAVATSYNGDLKVWDLEAGRVTRTLEGHSFSATAVAVTSDGRLAVSASADNTLKVWDITAASHSRALDLHSSPVGRVTATPDGGSAISVSTNMIFKIWALATGKPARTIEARPDCLNCLAVLPDGRRALSAAGDAEIVLWDLETGQILAAFTGHGARVWCATVTPDVVIAGSREGEVIVWNLRTREILCKLEAHKRAHRSSVTCVSATADSLYAITASAEGSMAIWDLESGARMHVLDGHAARVSALATTADGRFAISASEDRTVKIWEIETGRAVRTLEGHTDTVASVAVTSDGRLAISVSEDKTLRVWDLASGRPVATLATSAPLFCCDITPDNKTILVGDAAGAVHIVDWRNAPGS